MLAVSFASLTSTEIIRETNRFLLHNVARVQHDLAIIKVRHKR
jgi:hypothetical protein